MWTYFGNLGQHTEKKHKQMKLQIQKTQVNIEVLQVVNSTMGISVEL